MSMAEQSAEVAFQTASEAPVAVESAEAAH